MRTLVLAALAAAATAVAAPAARANGDPASDYLPARDVFLSFSEGVRETPSGQRLLETVANANKSGYRIKVAVIATPTDLGAVGGIFGQPQRYAEFLGQEISFVYRDRLLIAMPAGFGIYDAGRPVDAEQAVLKQVKIGPGIAGLDDAAADAVASLASSSGKPVAVASGGRSGWYSSAWFLALVAGCTAAAIGVGFFFGRRWLARAA
jgi:hypothetical protein